MSILIRITSLFKSFYGWLAAFLLTFPIWKTIYNAIDAWGNLTMVTDWIPSILKFLDSNYGTYTIMVIGFVLILLLLYRQKPIVENDSNAETQSETDLQGNVKTNDFETAHQNEIKALQDRHKIEIEGKDSEIQTLFNENSNLKSDVRIFEDMHKKEVESLKNQHKKEIISWQISEKNTQKIIDDYETTFLKTSWLIERADEQRVKIDNYVKLDKFFIYRVEAEPIPRIIFNLLILNNSLFDVTLVDKIEGYIEFLDVVLYGEKRFCSSPEAISSVSHKWFDLEHRLSREEFELIKGKYDKNEIIENDFNISNLILIIKGTDKFPQIVPKQVRINRHFRVWDYKEYAKSQDKFQQKEN